MGNKKYPVQATDEILGRFGNRLREARTRYRAFIEAGFSQGAKPESRGGGLVRSAGGWEELKKRGSAARELGDERVLGSGLFVENLLAEEADSESLLRPLDEILTEVAGCFGVSPAEILGPSQIRRITRCRAEFYRRGCRKAGLSYAELGRLVGRSEPAVRQALSNATLRHRPVRGTAEGKPFGTFAATRNPGMIDTSRRHAYHIAYD